MPGRCQEAGAIHLIAGQAMLAPYPPPRHRSSRAVNRQHDAMAKNITKRFPDRWTVDAAALARVDGTSHKMVKRSLCEWVERRRKCPEFKAELTRTVDEVRELLERLAT